jgi:VWFA-related protein
MSYKYTFNIALFILFCCGFLLFSDTPIQAQSAPKEKSKVKDFGSSLINQKEDKNEKPGNTAEKNKKSDEDIDDVIKIEIRLVTTEILVADRKGKAILGLKPSDFIVTEDNVPQDIATFTLGENSDIPKSIVLIIDYSGSQIPFIKNSVKAAKVLVDKLNPKDRMAIVTDDVELLLEFTADKKLLKKKLDQLAEKAKYVVGKGIKTGKSLQFSALMASLNELVGEDDVRSIIIFQSDGDEAFSLTPQKTGENNLVSPYIKLKEKLGISFTVNDLFNRIEKSRATIYSVITDHSMLGMSAEERFGKINKIFVDNNNTIIERKALSEKVTNYAERLFKQQTAMMIVARASGGFTESLETPEQADSVYSRILNDINNRYLIGYYPKNVERDGKRRNVKIEVRGHPEYIIWGRKTYKAPNPEK